MTDFEKVLKDRILAGENPQDMLKNYTAALESAQRAIKADQEAAQTDKVNDLCKRLLEGEVTHDDIALVYSTYMQQMFTKRGQKLDKRDIEEFQRMVNASLKQLEELFDALVALEKQMTSAPVTGANAVAVTDKPGRVTVKVKAAPDAAADDIIRRFVESIT